MVDFDNKRRDSKGKRQAAHCGFGVKHLVGQAVGEAAKRLHLRLLRRHDRRWFAYLSYPFFLFSLQMASVGMDMDVYRLEIYGTLWNIMEHYGTVSDVNTGVASWKLTLTRLWYGCCARRRVTWLCIFTWLFSQQIFAKSGKNGTSWHVERGAFFLDLWLGGWARRTSSHISCFLSFCTCKVPDEALMIYDMVDTYRTWTSQLGCTVQQCSFNWHQVSVLGERQA